MLITMLEGNALHRFLAATGTPASQDGRVITSVRLHQEIDGSIIVKVNGGIWSAPMGCLDPTSDLAYRRSL